jgi:hypothetical protein
VREGDVLVFIGGRLLIVDHLSETYAMDLVKLHDADATRPATLELPIGTSDRLSDA